MSASDFLSGAITKRYLANAAPSEIFLGAKSGKKKGKPPTELPTTCDTSSSKPCILLSLDPNCQYRKGGGKKKPGKKSPSRKKTPTKRTPRSR